MPFLSVTLPEDVLALSSVSPVRIPEALAQSEASLTALHGLPLPELPPPDPLPDPPLRGFPCLRALTVRHFPKWPHSELEAAWLPARLEELTVVCEDDDTAPTIPPLLNG
jgi:hypothetical protein